MVTLTIEVPWPPNAVILKKMFTDLQRQVEEKRPKEWVGKTPKQLFDYAILGERGEQVFVVHFDRGMLSNPNINLLTPLLDILKAY